MPKYTTHFDMIVSASYEFEANNKDEARAIIEKVNAEDIFNRTKDGLVWQWDEVISDSIKI